MRRVLALLLALLAARASAAPLPGGSGNPAGPTVTIDGSLEACRDVVKFDVLSSSLLATRVSNGVCRLQVADEVMVEGGQQVGASNLDFAPSVDLTSRTVDASAATATIAKTSASCAPTASGSWCYDSDTNRICVGDGSATRCVPVETSTLRIGGTGADGAMSFDGSCSAGGDCCRGGSISGSAPNKVCTYTANSNVGNLQRLTSATSFLASHVANWTSVSITGGTVTMAAPAVGVAAFIWRATGAISITGGIIDLAGKGGPSATSGSCASSNAGKNGGGNSVLTGGLGGASGNNAGSTGVTAAADGLNSLTGLLLLGGTGGGACPVSGQTSPGDMAVSFWSLYGGTGGAGGGCAASCSGTCGAGGRGGGAVRLESRTSITIGTSADIRVDGANGTTGGGGGGGGGVILYAPSITNTATTDTGTCTAGTPRICVGGGAAGSSPPTNCGAGGAGGDGLVHAVTVPG